MTEKKGFYPFRISAWMGERFGLKNLLLIGVFYLQFVLYLLRDSDWVPLLGGLVALWSYFLWLRVVDEHEDYEKDLRLFPERLLQRGVVTLRDLKFVGLVCVFYQLLWMLYLQASLTAWVFWACLLAYSFLSSYEFFQEKWFAKHPYIYATSHLILFPLAFVWVTLSLQGPAGLSGNNTFLHLANLSFASGALFELIRKIFPSNASNDQAYSYTREWGLRNAFIGVLLFLGLFYLSFFGLSGLRGSLSWLTLAFRIIQACGLLAVVVLFIRFLEKDDNASQKNLELGATLFLLLGLVQLGIAGVV